MGYLKDLEKATNCGNDPAGALDLVAKEKSEEEKIIEELADMDSMIYNLNGADYCFFCGSDINKEHNSGCIHERARKLVIKWEKEGR